MSTRKWFPENRKYVYQSLVVFAATLINLSASVAFGWASPSLPLLLAPGGPVQITVEQGTLIVSCLKIGHAVAAIPAAWLMDTIGRKRTLLVAAVPLLIVCIMLAFARTFELICVFTLVMGAASTFTSVVLPMYIAELSSAHIRGYLVALHSVTNKTGLLIIFGIGPFLSVQSMAWVIVVPASFFIALYWWLPESPYHLIALSKNEDAHRTLQRLRCSADVREELAQMEESVTESQANRGTFHELFFNPRNRRSIIVVLGLSGLIELSGSQIVLQYAQSIFATLDTDLEPKYASIIFGVAQLSGPIAACFLTDTMGRRPLLLTSIVASAVCTMVIGVYYILERHIDVTGLGWLPVTAIMGFMVSYTVGILVMMYLITSELFPKHLRGVASATKTLNISWIGFVLVYLYQYVVDVLGRDYVFVGFSLITVAFVPFVVFLVPETKRKTLESILKENKDKFDVPEIKA